MAIASKVTSRNRVAIPASVARELGIGLGKQVEWEINEDRSVTLRPILSRYELVKQLQGKWKDLFPPGFDPIGNLIRARENEDQDWEW